MNKKILKLIKEVREEAMKENDCWIIITPDSGRRIGMSSMGIEIGKYVNHNLNEKEVENE